MTTTSLFARISVFAEPGLGIMHSLLTMSAAFTFTPLSLWFSLVYMCATLCVFVLPQRRWMYGLHHVVSGFGAAWALFVDASFAPAVRLFFFLEISTVFKNMGAFANAMASRTERGTGTGAGTWERTARWCFVFFLFAFVTVRPFVLFKVSQIFHVKAGRGEIDYSFGVIFALFIVVVAMHVHWGISVTSALFRILGESEKEKGEQVKEEKEREDGTENK